MEAKPQNYKGGLGGRPQFRNCLFGLYTLPYGLDEVRMRNLGVKIGVGKIVRLRLWLTVKGGLVDKAPINKGDKTSRLRIKAGFY